MFEVKVRVRYLVRYTKDGKPQESKLYNSRGWAKRRADREVNAQIIPVEVQQYRLPL